MKDSPRTDGHAASPPSNLQENDDLHALGHYLASLETQISHLLKVEQRLPASHYSAKEKKLPP